MGFLRSNMINFEKTMRIQIRAYLENNRKKEIRFLEREERDMKRKEERGLDFG